MDTPVAPPTSMMTGAPRSLLLRARAEHTLCPQSLGRPKPSPWYFVWMLGVPLPLCHWVLPRVAPSLSVAKFFLIDPTQDTSMEALSSTPQSKANPLLGDEHGDQGGAPGASVCPEGPHLLLQLLLQRIALQDPPNRCQTPRCKRVSHLM